MLKKLQYCVLALSVLLVFPGCISKRPDVELTLGGEELTQENSRQVQDDQKVFSLTLPNNYDLALEMEDAGARLFKVNYRDADPPLSMMYIEESPAQLDQAAGMLKQEKTVEFLSEETVVVGGYTGKKISVQLSYASKALDYYFLRAGGKTYIFSQTGGQEWGFFKPVVESFKLAQ